MEEFLRAQRPEVAICAMPGIWDFFIARRLQELDIPIITIVHDAQSHPGDYFGPVYHVQRHLIQQSAGVITLSDFVAHELSRRGLLNGKVHATIPHIPFFFPDIDLPSPNLPKYPKRPVLRLLVAGRLQAYKGLELLVEALKYLPESGLQVRVVGKGNSKTLRKLASLERIDFHQGWCSERELIAHIDWTDVVLAPYTEATQSGIITLALDRWRPVIATPVGGLPEQVKHERTGLIAQDISARAIADAILRFYEQPQLFLYCREHIYKKSRTKKIWAHLAQQFLNIICKSIS